MEKLKTNRVRAIIFVNILALSTVITTSIFKELSEQGVTAPEYFLW